MGLGQRIGIAVTVFVLIFGGKTTTSLTASTTLFTSKRGFMFVDAFEGSPQFFQVSALFQNPAEVAGANDPQLSFFSADGYLGYQQLVGGVVLPIYVKVPKAGTLQDRLDGQSAPDEPDQFEKIPYTFGLGVSLFEASDLVYGSVGSNGRGERGDTFGDSLRQAVFVMAYSPLSVVDVGMSVRYFQRVLGTAQAAAYSVDFGVVLHGTDSLKLGVYTANLFQSDFEWSTTSTKETLNREVVMAVKYYAKDWDVAVSTDFSQYRFRGGWDLSGSFTLISDLVYSDDMTMKRYGYGTRMHLGDVAFEYFHSESVINSIDVSQDTLAIALTL